MRLQLLHKHDTAHDDSVWTAAWAAESNTLYTGSVDETVKSWVEAEDKLTHMRTLADHTLGVVSLATDSTGAYAASSALDSFIRVWSVADGASKATIETPPSETWSVAFAPSAEGKPLLLAAAGGSGDKVSLYNVDAPGDVPTTMAMPVVADSTGVKGNGAKDRFVLSVAVSPNGQRVAAGAMDGTIAVFDLPSGKLVHRLEGHYRPVRSLAFMPDSRCLVTACDDMHSHLYDVDNAQLIEAFSGHESWVLSVSVHPDGSAFASGGSDSKAKLWDLSTRSCVQTMADHTDQVWDVAFRPDGRRLATVSDDKSIALYDFA